MKSWRSSGFVDLSGSGGFRRGDLEVARQRGEGVLMALGDAVVNEACDAVGVESDE